MTAWKSRSCVVIIMSSFRTTMCLWQQVVQISLVRERRNM